MKVLFRIRGDVDEFPGGDFLQLRETKAALENRGIDCALAKGTEKMVGHFDVVHLFNTTRVQETYLHYQEARAARVPVVLSPIWHSLADMKRFYGKMYRCPFFPIASYLGAKELFYAKRSRLKVSLTIAFKFRFLQNFLVRNADAILPNSETELMVLTKESGVQPKAVFVSPLGMRHPDCSNHDSARKGDFICAGRIEPRKNQLAVIRAFKRLPRDGKILLIFGKKNESHQKYFRSVLAECCDGWVEYKGDIPHERLMKILQISQTSVLMSFFETFGLAALEGLACGTKLCLSDTAYNRGIYGDLALYADPYSVDSIYAAFAANLNASTGDAKEFLNKYTWEEAAATTIQAYEHVIGR